ncbi:MAG: protein kinase, partial [Elusimicrobiota bacterium]
MPRPSLRVPVFLLILAACAAAVPIRAREGDLPSDAVVKPDEVKRYSDPQFQALLKGARSDKRKAAAIVLTQRFFGERVGKLDKNMVFEGKQVNRIGHKVGRILKVIAEYDDAIKSATTQEAVEKARDTMTLQVAGISEGMMPRPSRGPGNSQEWRPEHPHQPPLLLEIAAAAARQARQQLEPLPPGGGSHPHVPPSGPALGVPSDPTSPTDAMTDARERYRNGDISGAISDASRAIGLGGGAEALVFRGGLLLDQKRYPQANQDAQQALRIDSENKGALALAQFSAGRGGAAGSAGSSGERSFMGGSPREALSGSSPRAALIAQSSRRSTEQFAREGENAMRLGDMAGAKAYADRGLAASPGDSYLLALRAAIRLHQREYDKALADARAGLEKDPKNQTLLRAKAFAENRLKRWRDAQASANRLLELDAKDAYGYAYRAHAYGGMGDRDAMMSDIRRAAQLDWRFADAARQAEALQLPSNADLLFLFPGEAGPTAAAPAPGGRNRRFSLLLGVSALGGLLLAFGLLRTVLKIMRTGPSVRTAQAAVGSPVATSGSPSGLIRGQYEISRQIGAGGMGMVFEGTDRSLGRRVAIKKMREEIRCDARERARFVTEAKTVAALHHANIVDIYAIAEDGEDVFLVFEYVDGKTVHELVQAGGGLDCATASRIVREAASALEYAHSRGIIHRDMKPSNVMVDGQGRVKVMDFGIARAAKDAMTRYSITNTVVGTPPYMAPEAEQGQVRRESDVYALAVCAYEMLTGKLPFTGTGGGMMLNKINMSYVPPSRQKEGLPPTLDAVFERAFQADPDKRYR